MSDRVAVILVNYNGWKDTIECLKSLEKVQYDNFEVVVVDNNSTDNSVAEIEKFQTTTNLTMTVIVHDENVGFAAGNNIGLRYVLNNDSDYFLFLNNDTIVDKYLFNNLLKPFKNTNVGATIGKIYYADEPSKIWYAGGELKFNLMKPSHNDFNEEETEIIHETREVSFATGCCLCCSSKCVSSVGEWSEDYFLYEEDVDYSIRIVNAGFKVVYISDAVIYHKVSSSTSAISNISQIYQVRNRMILINKYLSGIQKYLASLYTIALYVNRIRLREYTLSNVINGLKAYKNGETGRHI